MSYRTVTMRRLPMPDSPSGRLGGNRQAAPLALLAFAMLIVSLDQYIVVVALPEIGRALGYSVQTLQTVISAYAVASAGFLLLGGHASDLLGRRRIFVSGLALYAGGSLAGGLAPTPEVLLIARAVQGLGGRLSFPPPWRSSTPRSRKARSATAHWRSGVAPEPRVSWWVCCLAACSLRRWAGRQCSLSTCR